MYILIYLLSLGLVTYVTNKMNDVESNNEFLRWEKMDLLILGGLFLLGVILQCLDFLLPRIVLLAYLFVCVLLIFFVNKNREKHIQEYKKQIEQIFEAMRKLIVDKEINYNELPFSIERDKGKINKITVLMREPDKFNDGTLTNAVFSLKRYFPYYDWQFTTDFPKQEAIFEGQKLPPEKAMWPGSDLRDSSFIPLGLGGSGEIGLNLGSKKPGESMYVYEDGTRAGTTLLPSAPQILAVGATGGGKAIWVEQEMW